MNHTRWMAAAAAGTTLTATVLLNGCLGGSGNAAFAAPASRATVTVYAAGDIADCRKYPVAESGATRTADLIADGLAREPGAMAIALGDNTYPIGLYEEFTGCYEPTWGRFKSRTLPTPGNHEYYSPEAAGYYRYFGEQTGEGRRGYYSTDIGNWHVVSINSNLAAPDHAAQLDWLKKDLAAHPAACTLAFWHHPRYSSGGHGNNEKMQDVWKALDDAGAELVLAAHDHDYERFAPLDGEGKRNETHGIRSFVVGTGGAKLTTFGFRKAHSEVADNDSHGVLKLRLKPNGYEWEYLQTKPTGFQDKGAAACH